jgi:hypothetical protein
MQPADLSLLFKKIALSVVVAAVPLLILIGGLWLTRTLLDRPHNHALSTLSRSNP